MKIKVIMTGGTIAGKENQGVISNNAEKDVVDFYLESHSDVEFVKTSPYSILSENIEIENWENLIAELNQDYSQYSGIIITHGSDTLSYTSAMVSIYCQSFKIPVVLTGSNKVLSDSTSNGIENFNKAVKLVKENKIGVWTVFDSVYPAKAVMEADYFTDKFSLGGAPKETVKVSSNIKFKNKVQVIKEYPFSDYSCIGLSQDCKAVLLVGYHSGTARESNIEILLNKCREKNIPIYLQGLTADAGVYSSTDNIIKQGVIPLYDMTTEYAFAYLMFRVNL